MNRDVYHLIRGVPPLLSAGVCRKLDNIDVEDNIMVIKSMVFIGVYPLFVCAKERFR